jgi:RimJ/RimL family protein N-acetyltransferase
MPQPILNLVGERVALGPLEREHMRLFLHWMNDFSTQRTASDRRGPRTLEALHARHAEGEAGNDQAWFMIYTTAGWQPVGFTGLRDIDYAARSALFAITIAPGQRDAGYGTEATRLALDYGFTALGLHNILLTVASFNLRGQRAYTKAGFRECGRRSQVWPMAGQLWDEVYMECLATDFVSPALARVFAPDAERREHA